MSVTAKYGATFEIRRYWVYSNQPWSWVTIGIVIVPAQALPLDCDVILKTPSDEMSNVGRLYDVPKRPISPVIEGVVMFAGVEQLESVQFVKSAFSVKSATPILRLPSAVVFPRGNSTYHLLDETPHNP